jgi:hypothetical protein
MELVVAMAILVVAMIPLAFSFLQEQKLCRAYYYRAVAAQVVDGEMEALLAGEWRAFPVGTQPYQARAEAVKNLPPGRFTLSRTGARLRLEWTPEKRNQGGPVVREGVGR